MDAGAVGVVMLNNVEGPPIVMAGGEFGEQVTIPVLMVSDVTGAAIVAELANGVNSTMILLHKKQLLLLKFLIVTLQF